MPPPPVTPSPHRFVIKKEKTVRQTPLAQELPRPSSTQQFNATPRFTFSSTPKPTPTQEIPRSTPFASRYLTPARHPERQVEGINDSFSDDILQDEGQLHQSIEKDGDDIELDYDHGRFDEDFNLLDEPSPKRRRLSSSLARDQVEEYDEADDEVDLLPDIRQEAPNPAEEEEDLFSSSFPILSSPPQPRHKASGTASKFLPPTPLPPSTPLPPTSTFQTQTPFLKPPRFRPPDPSEQAQGQTDPLPEQFSPHRKGQKYIPGGLAAEVRDWLVNLESALPATSNSTSRNVNGRKEDNWAAKIIVDEVTGGGKNTMTLVKGRQIHIMNEVEGEMVDAIGVVKVILAGEGASVGLQKSGKVKVGDRVGIKGPAWEVVVDGEKWGVGVDWRVV